MIRQKKGQAAMEFLMTYGWAILAAVIVIGVLASFGVFSPSKYVPTSCSFSAPFGCVDNQVASNGTHVSFVLRNGGGSATNVTSVNITGCGANTDGYVIADGAEQLVTVVCGSTLTDKFSGDVAIKYKPIGGVLEMTSSGSVTVKVA